MSIFHLPPATQNDSLFLFPVNAKPQEWQVPQAKGVRICLGYVKKIVPWMTNDGLYFILNVHELYSRINFISSPFFYSGSYSFLPMFGIKFSVLWFEFPEVVFWHISFLYEKNFYFLIKRVLWVVCECAVWKVEILWKVSLSSNLEEITEKITSR